MFHRFKGFWGMIKTAQPDDVFALADKATSNTVGKVDTYIAPVRHSLLYRFPVLFGILVTFGATATFLGIEQMLLKYKIFLNHPEFIFLTGIIILAFTGRLYKKLSD